MGIPLLKGRTFTHRDDGDSLEVVFDMEKTHLFDPDTELALT